MSSEAQQSDRSPAPGDVRTAISDGLVALLKEYYGRGPERTWTYVSDDLVVCLLRGVCSTRVKPPRSRQTTRSLLT